MILRVNTQVGISQHPICGIGIVEGEYGEEMSHLICIRFRIVSEEQEKELDRQAKRCVTPYGHSSRIYLFDDTQLTPVTQEEGHHGRRPKVKATQGS